MKQFMDDYSLFEYCLARLEAGEDLDSILARFPDKAGQLQPLLKAALEARRSGQPVHIPASAKVDSRTRFLAEAGRMQKKAPLFNPPLRLARALVIVVLFLFAGLFGTGLASAEAVPGETLYPIKRAVEKAQLALTTDQTSKLDLEEEFDRRRVAETEKLVQTGRSESVTLAGTLNETTDHIWTVGGVRLNLPAELLADADSLRGSYVEVKGRLEGDLGLTVENMELRLFNISGVLDQMAADEWVVSGVKVLVMANTQITGKPAIGKRVALTTLHYNEDYFLALSVRVMGQGSNQNNQQDNPNKGKGNQGTEIDDDEQKTLTPSGTPAPDGSKETEAPTIRETDEDRTATVTYKPSETKETDSGDDEKDD